ncbi:hypothetical protein SAMN02745146_1841 [Hymenobacter daecheongensis DSM 21074]|uniref:Outer membrane protein beta-barrel domain-containing protein n=1 Tax=Hymenobacter daecheongensis DSM 21074 TaxID=1121955 RepID=A0A1M6EWH6_9BACT|nr:hypothetical protein [Hymenobacter daecheongensis]SHI89739.1 hypothetical protein SAMN02745146_1841 [Hymenobacter daecheongensis DSM 21074]
MLTSFASSLRALKFRLLFGSGPLLLLAIAAPAQRLEAVGVGASFNISQTWVRQRQIQVEQYSIRTDDDGSRLDDTGNRFSAFARIGLGTGKLFVQPELAYTSVLGNQSSITYFSRPDVNLVYPDVSYLYPRLRRTELALLGGLHLSRRFYVLAGPLLALNQREGNTHDPAFRPAELFNSLHRSVERVQVLGQLGVGLQLGRFDITARYERSLSPYTRAFDYNGRTYAYRQRTGQAIFGLGFLVFDRHRPWRR